MIYPLMPKGVEHCITAGGSGVRTSVVIYPLMPKGVEHELQELQVRERAKGDLSVDAERR